MIDLARGNTAYRAVIERADRRAGYAILLVEFTGGAATRCAGWPTWSS